MTLSLIMLAYTACSDYVDELDENRTLANRNYRNDIPGQPDREIQQFHPSNSLYYQQVPIPACTADHTVGRADEAVRSRENLEVEFRGGFFHSMWRGLTGVTDEYPANYYPGQSANLVQHTREQYGVDLPPYSPAHTSYFPQPQSHLQPQPSGSQSQSQSGVRSYGQE